MSELEPRESEPKHSEHENADSPYSDLSLAQKTKNVTRAARADYRNSAHKAQMIATAAGVVGLQAADRLRASVIFVPTIAVNVFENTQSPVAAAIAGGVAFGGWCAAVGGATAEGLDKYSGATKEFEKNFPGVVGFFEDALPGFETSPYRKKKLSTAKYIGNRLTTRLKRAYTVSGIGSVAYVSAASAKGWPKKDIHRLNMNASADGAGAIGAVIFGAGEAILKIGESNPALAEQIQNTASDIRLWYGIAGLMILQNYISNRLRRRRANSHDTLTNDNQT